MQATLESDDGIDDGEDEVVLYPGSTQKNAECVVDDVVSSKH